MSYPGPQPWSGQSFDPSTPNPHFNTPQYYAHQAQYQQGQPYPPPINKHVGWHVVNWLFFWPTAIYALVAHMLKIDESLRYGNFGRRPGARPQGPYARHHRAVHRAGLDRALGPARHRRHAAALHGLQRRRQRLQHHLLSTAC